MLTRKDVIKAIKVLRGEVHPNTNVQIVMALKLYKDRDEFDWTVDSAIECLKLAGYEIEE